MVDTLLDTLIDAFMSVGVILAGVMLLVRGLRMAWGARFEQALGSGRRDAAQQQGEAGDRHRLQDWHAR